MLFFGLSVLAGTAIALESYQIFQKSRNFQTRNPYAKKKYIKNLAKKQKNILKTQQVTSEHYLDMTVFFTSLFVLSRFYPPLLFLSLVGLSYVTHPILKETAHSLFKEKNVKFDMINSMVSLAAFIKSIYFFVGLNALLHHLGNTILLHTKNKNNFKNLLREIPEIITIIQDNKILKILRKDLKDDDFIFVKQRDVIPVDGIIIEGEALIDQKDLMGEHHHVYKRANDSVFATTQVITGKLILKIEKKAEQSIAAEVETLLAKTSDFKIKAQLENEKLTDTGAKILIGLGAILTPFIGGNAAVNLIGSAPNNEARSYPPMHIYLYLKETYAAGILFKEVTVLEKLKEIDVIVFDKTGTLTKSHPELSNIILFDQAQEEDIIRYAAAAEQRIEHPIAKAILQEAQHLQLPEKQESHYYIGQGVSAVINHKQILIGNERFIQEQGVDFTEEQAGVLEKLYQQSDSITIIVIDKTLKAILSFSLPLYEQSIDIIHNLIEQDHYEFALISGDHAAATKQIAQMLNIKTYYSNALAQDKADLVHMLQEQGKKVCFIGDGTNDIKAMQQADISISLKGAACVATDHAQIVFMDGEVKHLQHLFQSNKMLQNNIRTSIGIYSLYGITNFSGALFFHFGIATGLTLAAIEWVIALLHAENAKQRLNKALK